LAINCKRDAIKCFPLETWPTIFTGFMSEVNR
jgi:hypothetical protein